MTDKQDLKRYKYGYSSDEWGMGRILGLIPDPAGNVCLFTDVQVKLEAAQAEIERLTHAHEEARAFNVLHHGVIERRTKQRDQAIARLAEVQRANHEWHLNHDEHDGYQESELWGINTAAGASPVQPSQSDERTYTITQTQVDFIVSCPQPYRVRTFFDNLKPNSTQPSQAGELSDTALLDWLQAKGGQWICHDSTTGRGWRLNQSQYTGSLSVREAIIAAINAKESK